MPTLFSPLALGALTAPNRIIMAPLTRSRATPGAVPTAIMVDYYAQRASAGLIISEAIGVSRQGNGFTYTPGLWSDEQVEAWKPVTRAVHDKGGLIIAQLGHTGRAGHSTVIGERPVSSSVPILSATPMPASIRSTLRSSRTTSTSSSGCSARNCPRWGIMCSLANVTAAQIRRRPDSVAPIPRAARSASSASSIERLACS
jgi:2,4-dienoyl-CoA reductase-like NADH-dependent reductase (Old Yellow Enzyme family)